MAHAAVDIVNSALARIGQTPITAAQFAAPDDEVSTLCALHYGPTRDEEQRLHPWVFTLVRARLDAYDTPATTLTPGATTGTGVTFTASGDAFLAEDVGKTLEHQAGPGTARITGYTSPTVVTATITEDFPSTSAIAAGAWRRYLAAPAHTWARTIAKPSDLLRLLRVRHQVPYRAEGRAFVTDADSLEVVYIAQTTISEYELVQNGNFITDLSSWSVVNTGTGTTVWHTDGIARMNAGASGTTRLDQTIPTVPGEQYVLGWTSRWQFGVGVGTVVGNTDIALVFVGAGIRTLTFTARTATTWIGFTTSENVNVDLDNISVKRTEFDPLFDEALAARLAMKLCYGIAGKLDLLKALSELYGAVIQRAREANAIEAGEGKWEEDPADDTMATIVQDAVARLIAQPVNGPLDPIDLTAMANRAFPKCRAELQRLHPWRFTRTRTQLDSTTTVTLTPGAVSGDAVTFTASGDVFVAGDVGSRLLIDQGGVARIVGVTSATVVTATIETDLASGDPIAAGAWHIGPPWRWAYRYVPPAGFLRLLETQAIGWWHGAPVVWPESWGWRYTWGTRHASGTAADQEPAVLEGAYLVANAGPTLQIEYVQEVTDPAQFDPSFASALAALIAWRLALPLLKEPGLAKWMSEAFAGEMKAVRTADKLDTRVGPLWSDSLLTVRY
jgi:hypothetical protein